MGIFRIGRLAVLGAAASAALLLAPTAAMAAPGAAAGVVVGNGTISPGLTTVTQPVSGGFTGALTGAGTSGVISDSCIFSFASGSGGFLGTGNALGGDNVAYGAGSSSGSCSGTEAINASLGYTRLGPLVLISGSGSAGSTANATFVVVCVFATQQTPPITNFTLVCVTAGAGAS
jgi:hypothetical protein